MYVTCKNNLPLRCLYGKNVKDMFVGNVNFLYLFFGQLGLHFMTKGFHYITNTVLP